MFPTYSTLTFNIQYSGKTVFAYFIHQVSYNEYDALSEATMLRFLNCLSLLTFINPGVMRSPAPNLFLNL
jgi:hypothetical protein